MSMNIGPAPTSQDYDYTASGIDNFLGRSLDQVTWQSTLGAMLNMPGNESLTTLQGGNTSNQLNFDAAMVNGSLGNTMNVGPININGASGNITMNDGNNTTLLIGNPSD